MDGSDGRTDLRLSHPDSLGIYHRSSSKPDGSALLIGTPSLRAVKAMTFTLWIRPLTVSCLEGVWNVADHTAAV